MPVVRRFPQIVRETFRAYVEDGCSMRQLALRLSERAPSPNGKPVWSVSMIGRLLRNEAYIGTVYCNRHVAFEGERARRGVRNRKTSRRERPREQWIPITVPAIVEPDLFERAQRVSRDNSKFNPRGAEPGTWLLRGLVECGHCQVGCSSQKKPGRNGRVYRYYYCHNHDPINAGGRDRLCPERHIRADELDAFVFDKVCSALLDPRQLTAGEGALLTATQPSEDELVAAQLKQLTTALEAADRERTRLLDAYQAGLIDLDQLGRRTQALTDRRDRLSQENHTLSERSSELASQNRLRRGLARFAERVAASLDQLDFDARQRLLRLVVEKVRVQGWRAEIHLKIPLPNNDADDNNGGQPPLPTTPPRPSSDVGLRPLYINGEEVAGEPRRRVLAQERAPVQLATLRCRRNTGRLENVAHQRGRDVDTEPAQLTDDPDVAPAGVLARQPNDQRPAHVVARRVRPRRQPHQRLLEL
jgi:site-specific DNA recombinase